jgi:hypothetical protein
MKSSRLASSENVVVVRRPSKLLMKAERLTSAQSVGGKKSRIAVPRPSLSKTTRPLT